MTKRTILTGLGTYVDKRGNPGAWAWKGQEVDVHDDYLEEFDAMNVENGDGQEVVYERVGVNMISPAAAAQAAPSEEEGDEAPKKVAPAKKAT
jgi:hypothetical protein